MLDNLPKKSNDNRTGAGITQGTITTPAGKMHFQTWLDRVQKIIWKRRRVWVHCQACCHRWVLCWAPVTVSNLNKFQTDCCPFCHNEGKVFMGKGRGLIASFIHGYKTGGRK